MHNFEVKDSRNNLGLFTKQPFKAGQTILRFEGKIISEQEIDTYTHEKAYNCLQFDLDKYLYISDDNSLFVNHSCAPNCYIKSSVNKSFLIALMDIEKDSELFFDYSTTSTDSLEDYNMSCNCGIYSCRKNISGFSTIPAKQQKEYINSNIVPEYVLNYFGIK